MTQDEMHQQKIRETIAHAQRAMRAVNNEEAAFMAAAHAGPLSAAQGYGTTVNTGQSGIQGSASYGTTSGINSGGRNYGSTTTSTSGWSDDKTEDVALSQSSDLPNISLMTWDENGNKVELTLKPEANISASDSLKLIMLVMAMSAAPYEFSALAYVKKNNLERHFTYS